MCAALSHHLEYRERPLVIRVAAAGHDCEASGLRAHLAAGDWSVHPRGAFCKLAGLGDASGAEIDEQRIFRESANEPVASKGNFLDHFGRREVEADGFPAHLAGKLAQRGGSAHALCLGCLSWSAAAVPNNNLRPSLMQMPRHCSPHVAQADETDLVSCKSFVHVHKTIPEQPSANCKRSPDPHMKVIITGGGGFLGSQLCEKLLQRGELTGPSGTPEKIEQIVLLDARFSSASHDARVQQITGDISQRDIVFSAVGVHPATSIFHLASMVSGECEERYDDALRVNLDGGRNVFEAARALGGRARVVFASSIACFGGGVMQDPNTDATKLAPQTTYGMTKAICELLVNDHSRKGHFDGRSARLPTVIVRPGKPNAAASSWASGMFREPLGGEPCLLPVRREQSHPMTGYRTVVDSLVALHEVPAERFNDDRAIGLPAHRVTPLLAEATLREVAQERGLKLGPIVDAFDPRIQGIVDNWPVSVEGGRALALGLPSPPPLKEIIAHYLEDFCSV